MFLTNSVEDWPKENTSSLIKIEDVIMKNKKALKSYMNDTEGTELVDRLYQSDQSTHQRHQMNHWNQSDKPDQLLWRIACCKTKAGP